MQEQEMTTLEKLMHFTFTKLVGENAQVYSFPDGSSSMVMNYPDKDLRFVVEYINDEKKFHVTLENYFDDFSFAIILNNESTLYKLIPAELAQKLIKGIIQYKN